MSVLSKPIVEMSTTPTSAASVSYSHAGGHRRYLMQLRVCDAAMALAAGIAAYLLRFGATFSLSTSHLIVALTLPVVWLVLVSGTRGYELRYLHLRVEETRHLLRAGVALASVGALASYSFKLDMSRGYMLAIVVLTFTMTLSQRLVLRACLTRQRVRGTGWMRRVLVVGHWYDVDPMLRELGRTRDHGFQVVGACLAGQLQDAPVTVPITGGFDRVDQVAAERGADVVVVLPGRGLGPAEVRRIGWQLERSGVQLLVGCAGLLDVGLSRTTILPVGPLALIDVSHAELHGARRVAKASFDRVFGLVLLVLASPFLLVLMLAVRMDSPGPAIFRQVRAGQDGRTFEMLKLRTMTVDAESRRGALSSLSDSDGLLFKIHDDPRITRFGRVLRRLSLDELPQLVNVVRGEMSLVGPRPPLCAEVEAYEDDVRRRLVVKPGLTGLWQVSGRSDLSWDESVRLDLRYVDNWSLALDLRILWSTARAVLSRSGAY